MTKYKIVPVEIIDRFPEINTSNYDHDDVCALNEWGVELVLAAAAPEMQGEPDYPRLRQRFDEIEREMCEGKHTASSVFTQMRTDVFYAAPQPVEQQPDVDQLVEALESTMKYIPLDIVRCRGDKCRELWCASCFDEEEAESYLITAERHLKNAESALISYRKGEEV